ncbi:MAG: TrkH family potassium uptake protein [Ruminococcaceae bacterium]|nr:TrkH family potassium uptake protein [Oscillospiraceae bacterium]
MNRRMVFYMLGKIIFVEALLLTLPFAVSLIYKESCAWSFLITIGIALAVGLILTVLSKPSTRLIYAKEGFVLVAIAWILMSLIGALPFTISGEIPNYVDAIFETVSGFTTTGASILTNIEALSHGTLFWRSFTHWVGGMGVLVFVMALVPSLCDRSIHILRAEVPGPVVGKLVPKIKQTAKILYLIYIALTLVQVILLWCGDMNLFESLIHSFGTAGTGGFSSKADSIAGYSAYSQWVITIFMLVFGLNFNIFFFILIKRVKSVLKNEEMWAYFGIVAVSIAIVTANTAPIYETFAEALRHSAFQVASIISTTGYTTADYTLWPQLIKTLLLILMIIGSCAGSTAGGLKVSRVVMLFKQTKKELLHMLHPRSVSTVKIDGKKVDSATLHSVCVYFAVYMVVLFLVFLLLSLETSFSFESNLSATIACFNNIGPGLGAVGPVGSYAAYSPFSKILLSLTMLFGRLEIYPLLFALTPSTWTKKIR